MGKSTINGPFSNSKLLVYQRLSASHNLPRLGPQPTSIQGTENGHPQDQQQVGQHRA